jgi:sulfoxide reductase heme-binding subunit YedZ
MPTQSHSSTFSLALYMPWTNAQGHFRLLRAIVFMALLLPALWMTYKYEAQLYSPKPLTDLIRESGDWSLRLLVASLAITPFALLFKWAELIDVRRMVGLASLFYALAHIVFYCVDEQFAWLFIVQEIISRLFLTIGMIATCGLIILGITSNDWSLRAMGGRGWSRLHSWVYVITILGILHYLMEVRLDAYEAVVLAGLFLVLMAYRIMRKKGWPLHAAALLIMGCVMACATALLEASYYGLATRFGFWRVLSANSSFAWPLRPAYWVLIASFLLSAAVMTRMRLLKKAH